MKMKLYVGLCLIGLTLAADWSYDSHGNTKGPAAWNNIASICNGNRQSPISIPYGHVTYDPSLTSFNLTGYDDTMTSSGPLQLTNNGHTVVLNVNTANATKMSGGGLDGEYYAAQLHYHWGADDSVGSEHAIDNRYSPLEVHLVHYKASAGSVSAGLQSGDGLAVLGFLFEIDEYDQNNTRLDPLITSLTEVLYKNGETNIAMNFAHTMPEDWSSLEYYRYLGSLTTPTCDEAVVWTVFENRIPISTAQLAKFRELKQLVSTAPQNYPLTYNYRPLQPLGNREVKKNFDTAQPASYSWDYVGYQGVDSWSTYYATCSGKKQSPIDIPAVTSVKVAQFDSNKGLDTLEFINYDQTINGIIKNNGHTIQVDVNNDNIYIHKGDLVGRFKVAQFHFHWGRNNNEGSEHTHNGRKYPLELHIVHYNESYGSLAKAAGMFDGLAVVGFWFEIGAENTNYSPIISSLPDVKFKDANRGITGFTLRDLSFPDLKSSSQGRAYDFFRYDGGLTTPGCNEHVIWTMMTNTVKISNSQLVAFREMLHVKDTGRTLVEKDKIGLNYRPTQPLYNRVVHASWNYEAEVIGAAPKAVQSLVTCVLLMIIGVFLS
uniref:carbonic anhydrase n=12 Tax=Tridacna gigas TaxID=80829 RepID=Q4VPE4_TRIGG|nr:carbonic anhydrase precursor [Tridacna gigas]